MKLKNLLFTALISSTFFSCSNDASNDDNTSPKPVVIEERVAIPQTAASELIQQLKPKTQSFQFKADADYSIQGEAGTQIYIPQNSFVNKNGELIKGEVKMEIIEVLSVTDFVKTNLQTRAGDQLLQSEGMIFIEATANGESVALAPDKKLQIDLPKIPNNDVASDIRIFSGTYDDSGNVNWEENSQLEKQMIAIPLDMFDYWRLDSIQYYKEKDEVHGYSHYYADSLLFKQKKLENTFIATLEFEERFKMIEEAEYAASYYLSVDLDMDVMVLDSTLSTIYLNNLDKDLWYCDSLAYNYLNGLQSSIDGVERLFDHLYSMPELVAIFERFYKERLTTVISIPTNIDLSKKDALQQLKKQGYSNKEADKILGAYKRQQAIINKRKDKETVQNLAQNSFVVAQLGWINCDRFYDDPNAKEADILLSITNQQEHGFVITNLIIHDQRMALNGKLSKDSSYTFTGETAPYTKLPIGKSATVFALSYKNGKPYIGKKEFTISEKENLEIDLVESSVEEINETLKTLN